MKDATPGTIQYETTRGRIPLWLSPDMIAFILSEWRRLPDDTPDAILKQWGDLAFFASSALHKGAEAPPQKSD